MTKEQGSRQKSDYQRVEAAIRYLEANYRAQPSLEEIAASVHLSKYHFQRLFKRWAGISPTQFMHYLTIEYAKARLQESHSVLDAALDAGLSGPGRLHDLFVSFEAMTPGEYKREGAGLEIVYGFHASPFGGCLLAATQRGICGLHFLHHEDSLPADLAGLAARWPGAAFAEDPGRTQPLVDSIFEESPLARRLPFHLMLRGTNFQVSVWQALLAIPPGAMVSYGDVAAYLGRPAAAQAVGNAVAQNPIGYLIPCHRVINKAGGMGGYQWGTARKKAMLGWEASRRHLGQTLQHDQQP
jgi:AraC family transcriptional regulator of adaptative response/methylated-DNA-[protein]-cysteine methyltransferase